MITNERPTELYVLTSVEAKGGVLVDETRYLGAVDVYASREFLVLEVLLHDG